MTKSGVGVDIFSGLGLGSGLVPIVRFCLITFEVIVTFGVDFRINIVDSNLLGTLYVYAEVSAVTTFLIGREKRRLYDRKRVKKKT
jgi:hypothetical protein